MVLELQSLGLPYLYKRPRIDRNLMYTVFPHFTGIIPEKRELTVEAEDERDNLISTVLGN